MEWMHLTVGHILHSDTMWSQQEACDNMDRTKACGPPYNWLYGPTKGHVLEHLTWQDLEDHFNNYDQASNATLKDEIRQANKDARVFIPANICMVYKGNHLFGAQNDNLCGKPGPIKIGLSTPAPEARQLWIDFSKCVGKFIQLDGKGHDTRVSPSLAMLCRDLRKCYLPVQYHKQVDRYYDMTYCMNVNIRGHLIQVIGQQSGHTNTASDNSLISLALVIWAFIKNDYNYEEFQASMLAIMGDDVMMNSPLNEEDLVGAWADFGMFIQIPDFNQSFWDMTFMGMHPAAKNGILGYSYDHNKMFCSLNYIKKGRTVRQQFDKLLSLCQLMYFSEHYETFYSIVVKFARDKHASAMLTDEDLKSLALISPRSLINLYCGEECAGKC
jgi:hypothetical protein